MRWWPALVCAVLLAGCGRADPAVSLAAAAPSVIAQADTMARYDGYGALRFGMDEATFDKAWGGELKGAPEQDSSCFYKTPTWVKLSRDFAFMFEDGRFVRYDVGTAKEVAPDGGKLGMDEAHIRTLYGARVQMTPHKYLNGAKYLRIAALQGEGALVFETDEHGKVTRWRAGVPPQVDYVEGCH